jgi:hypothetical protein
VCIEEFKEFKEFEEAKERKISRAAIFSADFSFLSHK